MKQVTREFLKRKSACLDGVKWWEENCEGLSTEKQLMKLVKYRADWANWLIVRLMNKKQKVQYAVFTAEQVIDIYEKKYPGDNRPRKAIEAAKKYINKQTRAAADAARAAADAARAAADAADAARAAAYAAADAAYAAAYAAYAAAYAAYAAAYAAARAAYAAAYAVEKRKMKIKIIKYGIKILKESEKK